MRASSLVALPQRTLAFFQEARQELKKVSWPSRETTIRYTMIVVISSLVAGLVTGGVDYLLTLLIETFI